MQQYYCYHSKVFKKSLKKYRKKHTITDRELTIFQNVLAVNPLRGLIIPRYSYLKKIRFAVESLNVGKSDGYRVIYSIIYQRKITIVALWDIYYKKDKTDLTDNEYKLLINLHNDLEKNIDLNNTDFIELKY